MTDFTRSYEPTELPRVGDVVRLFNDAFGTGIITEVEGDYCLVERVHCFVTSYGRNKAQLSIGIERVERVSKEFLAVYMSGSSLCILNVDRKV